MLASTQSALSITGGGPFRPVLLVMVFGRSILDINNEFFVRERVDTHGHNVQHTHDLHFSTATGGSVIGPATISISSVVHRLRFPCYEW